MRVLDFSMSVASSLLFAALLWYGVQWSIDKLVPIPSIEHAVEHRQSHHTVTDMEQEEVRRAVLAIREVRQRYLAEHNR